MEADSKHSWLLRHLDVSKAHCASNTQGQQACLLYIAHESVRLPKAFCYELSGVLFTMHTINLMLLECSLDSEPAKSREAAKFFIL